MDIRMIALDLDGTTMNSDNRLPEYNKSALEEAIARGIDVVVATGRTYNSLPGEVLEIEGLRYVITSNGAFITDLYTGDVLRSNYIKPEALRTAIGIAEQNGIEIEVFCNGQAYDQTAAHEEILRGNRPYRNIEYIRTTRIPKDDLFTFIYEHDSEIENINFNFKSNEHLEEFRASLESIPGVSTTSSLRLNMEVGGAGSTKSEGVRILMETLGHGRENLMCFGDAPNDIPMIEFAGFGVAVGNAWSEVKEHADYVSESNDENGVGRTIRKFAFGQRDL